MSGLWVFLGGGTGALLRYLLAPLAPSPWGTVGVNLIGSFLLAALMHPQTGASDAWRLALGVGVMGGFTTYSSFNFYVLSALQHQHYGHAFLQVATTVLGALAASGLGWAVAGRLGP